MAKSEFIEVGYDVNAFDVNTALISFSYRLMISHHHTCLFELFTRQTQMTLPRNINYLQELSKK
jgi:hypothetical protein